MNTEPNYKILYEKEHKRRLEVEAKVEELAKGINKLEKTVVKLQVFVHMATSEINSKKKV